MNWKEQIETKSNGLRLSVDECLKTRELAIFKNKYNTFLNDFDSLHELLLRYFREVPVKGTLPHVFREVVKKPHMAYLRHCRNYWHHDSIVLFHKKGVTGFPIAPGLGLFSFDKGNRGTVIYDNLEFRFFETEDVVTNNNGRPHVIEITDCLQLTRVFDRNKKAWDPPVRDPITLMMLGLNSIRMAVNEILQIDFLPRALPHVFRSSITHVIVHHGQRLVVQKTEDII
jgi:hypothetical protein